MSKEFIPDPPGDRAHIFSNTEDLHLTPQRAEEADDYFNKREQGIKGNKVNLNNPLDTQVGGDHYKNFKIQPVEFCQKNRIPYCESNVIKYVCRHEFKNGKEDLEKARHYIDLLIKMEYSDVLSSDSKM
jgi:hypothetical protein